MSSACLLVDETSGNSSAAALSGICQADKPRAPRKKPRCAALAVGQHTNDKELSYYAMAPSGFEWVLGWNPIVVDEQTWEPTAYQGISV